MYCPTKKIVKTNASIYSFSAKLLSKLSALISRKIWGNVQMLTCVLKFQSPRSTQKNEKQWQKNVRPSPCQQCRRRHHHHLHHQEEQWVLFHSSHIISALVIKMMKKFISMDLSMTFWPPTACLHDYLMVCL